MEHTGTDFRDAIVYALSCFDHKELILKAKQEEVLTNLYDGRGRLCLVSSTGYCKYSVVLPLNFCPLLFYFELKQTCSLRVIASTV